jgi:hypothetical protein
MFLEGDPVSDPAEEGGLIFSHSTCFVVAHGPQRNVDPVPLNQKKLLVPFTGITDIREEVPVSHLVQVGVVAETCVNQNSDNRIGIAPIREGPSRRGKFGGGVSPRPGTGAVGDARTSTPPVNMASMGVPRILQPYGDYTPHPHDM